MGDATIVSAVSLGRIDFGTRENLDDTRSVPSEVIRKVRNLATPVARLASKVMSTLRDK